MKNEITSGSMSLVETKNGFRVRECILTDDGSEIRVYQEQNTAPEAILIARLGLESSFRYLADIAVEFRAREIAAGEGKS